jgi:DNA-binding MarR family transcriptional regulator
MNANRATDVIDQVVSDVQRRYAGLEPVGLPITGRILRLAQFFQMRREEQLAPFGISVADFDVLATLVRRAGTGTVNVRDLQQAMMLSSSGITKRLDRLESGGLIARSPDPTDRRGVLIRLTEAGVVLIDAAIPAITDFESKLVGAAVAGERDRAHVESSLRRLLVAQESWHEQPVAPNGATGGGRPRPQRRR